MTSTYVTAKCPDCGAQLKIFGRHVPEEGSDVICTGCGHALVVDRISSVVKIDLVPRRKQTSEKNEWKETS